MTSVGVMSFGDVTGFVALFLTALAAVMMLLRPYILKMTRNLGLVRVIHVVISTGAGVFIVLHISATYLPPTSVGVSLGYVTIVVSLAAWLTGTAFLKKVKDSLFYHGVLSASLLPLALMHAALTSANLVFVWGQVLLLGAAGVAFANASLHAYRMTSFIRK